ncbi:hypothetical protein [Salmonella sp. s55044]|uniref:hypothetical protein n=1 Tax=Salmonella sp. s55044 TaxID=3159677 RepID=UPI0039806B1A
MQFSYDTRQMTGKYEQEHHRASTSAIDYFGSFQHFSAFYLDLAFCKMLLASKLGKVQIIETSLFKVKNIL